MSILTYRRLELLGRLGNMLWEISSTIGLAATHGMRPLLPRWSYAPYYSFPPDLWADEIPDDAIEAETMPEVIERIAPRHRSYLQDKQLWWDIRPQIISHMKSSSLARTVLHQTNPEFFEVPSMDRVGVHIRRGDAIAAGPKLYPLQSPMYVERALEVLQPKPGALFVFSDDATWCRMNLAFTGGHVVTGNADWGDQHLMAMCGGGLAIANSSFSYWAGVRSATQKVCYPNTWYGPGFRHDLSHKPMIPDGWTGIDDPKAGSKSCV